ncbi:MAG TPA: methyltransferase [Bryobacteraceae bacterium]|nr:methyltransferase [Bryobacteraceae bacterium]
MQPFRYHVFVCDQQKPEGVPCCSARGARKVLDALRAEVAAQGLAGQVQLTPCGSLGLCERGPNLVVYPEGTWYSGVSVGDLPELVRSHFANGHPVERLANHDAAAVRAEIEINKTKMLAGMQAKDAAGALPDDLAQTIRGFQDSRAILTGMELDAFTAVGDGASAEQAASKMATDARATGMLLDALTALGLLAKRDGRFYNTAVSARYFAAGAPDDARAATMHTANLWQRWSTLTDCVRTGTSVARREPPDAEDRWTEPFIAAMHRNARERAPHVLRAVGTEGLHHMLDVGGGSGAYSIAFAQASPDLEVVLLDRPEVLAIARRHIQSAGLAGRVTTRVGDLRTDRFGAGFDLALVSAICHMLGEDENRDLLRRCREALAPGGRLVIQDFILDEDKTAPRMAALFSLNMLVGTERGASYNATEYATWLREAGFGGVNHVRLPGPSGLMIGAA